MKRFPVLHSTPFVPAQLLALAVMPAGAKNIPPSEDPAKLNLRAFKPPVCPAPPRTTAPSAHPLNADNACRDHHPDTTIMWFQATLLKLLGFDHTKLSYRFQGRDFRLTDVFGDVVDKMLA